MPILRKSRAVKRLTFEEKPDKQENQNKEGQDERSQRPKRNSTVPQRANVVDLEKMSSNSFMAYIGESSAPAVVEKSKVLHAEKKQLGLLQHKILTQLNGCVLDGVSIDESDWIDKGAVGPDMEKRSAPVNINANAEHSSPVKQPDSSLNVVSDKTASPVNKQQASASIIAPRTLEHQNDDGSPSIAQRHFEVDCIEGNDNLLEDTIGMSDTDFGLGADKNESTIEENADQGIKSAIKVTSTHCQTDKCKIICGCKVCRNILAEFAMILKTGKSTSCLPCLEQDKGLEPENPLKSQVVSDFNMSKTSLASDANEELIPLYRGSDVKISVTTKAKLRSITSGQPKTYVNLLMEAFFTRAQMANMTAEGRSKTSVAMDPKIKDALYVYLFHKFPDFEQKDLTDLINKKCYCERRKGWQAEDGEVRQRMQKKTRDPSKPAKKIKNKSSRRKKERDWEMRKCYAKESRKKGKHREDKETNGNEKRSKRDNCYEENERYLQRREKDKERERRGKIRRERRRVKRRRERRREKRRREGRRKKRRERRREKKRRGRRKRR